MDSNDHRKRARHHHSGQVHLGALGRHPHQHRRHPRPRRLRRRGRAHPVDGRRRDRAGRRRRRPDAADQVRGRQGAEDRPAPIVAINKVDRPDARITEVVNDVFDLFAALDATDEQLDFPLLYASGRNGWMADSPDASHDVGMTPLFDLIVKHVPPPVVEEGPFRLLGTCSKPTPFSAASSPAASRRARSSRTRPSRCCRATARRSRPAASPRSWPSAA